MKNSFILRIYKDKVNNITLSSIQDINISGITIISKQSKFGDICMHKSNQKKFGYKIILSESFNKISGSHSTPTLTFKGNYIDIIIHNFPYYPVFTQSEYAVRSVLQGYGYINFMNKGFPLWTAYRDYQFIKI